MKLLNYDLHYSHILQSELQPTNYYISVILLNELEPRIQYYSSVWHIRKFQPEDVAQELRSHLWQRLNQNKYDSAKSAITTWGNFVIRNKLFDLTHPKRNKKDLLDADGRTFLPL